MAKQTRTQRRARREARETSAVGSTPSPGSAPSAPTSPAPVARPGAEEHRRGGPRLFRFIRESAAELQKVEWPTQTQVVTGTTVVLIACIIVGAFLYLNDEVWKRVVEHIVLR